MVLKAKANNRRHLDLSRDVAFADQVPFPFKLSFHNYLYLCIDFLHRPVESQCFWFLVRGVKQHPLNACLRVADRIDDQGLVSFTMDWMQAIGSDVMINDDQLTTALQHLLVSVEKGIERLEWNVIPKPWINTINSGEGSSTFPRCCHVRSHPVDMKDSSVQTTPEDESEQEGDSPIVIKDSELTNSEVNGVFLRKFACIQQDNQSVSVVRKNYVPSCESIATQTSTAPSKSTEKAPNDLLFALPPIAVREEDPDDGYCEHVLTQPATISQVDPDLLHSEVALLPGCRDIKNRSIVVIQSDGIQDGFQLSSCHLAQLLLYFHTIPKLFCLPEGATVSLLLIWEESKQLESGYNLPLWIRRHPGEETESEELAVVVVAFVEGWMVLLEMAVEAVDRLGTCVFCVDEDVTFCGRPLFRSGATGEVSMSLKGVKAEVW
ncbi:pleckstrin y domain-containing family G member 4B [Trichonephila clavipes]|nr:pleckstrin y domain-containing family G member 4B [Trichonephila clavipes]